MHRILDIAKELNPNIKAIDLDRLSGPQEMDQIVTECKRKNQFIFLYAIDNFRRQRHYVEQVRQSYDNFAFSTCGLHQDNQHIPNVHFLSFDACDPTQPLVRHDSPKKYPFVFLTGQLHKHRWDMLLALSDRGILKDTLLSLQNYDHAHAHLFPKLIKLPAEYEWPEIQQLGGYQQKHQVPSPMSDAIGKYNGKAMPRLYADTGCSILSETNQDKGIVYLTEKTWIPIVAEHLLLIQGNHGTNEYLRSLGFDLDYEGIPDYDNTDHEHIADICGSIREKDLGQLYKASRDKRRNNRVHALDEKFWIDYHRKQLKNFGGPFV